MIRGIRMDYSKLYFIVIGDTIYSEFNHKKVDKVRGLDKRHHEIKGSTNVNA